MSTPIHFMYGAICIEKYCLKEVDNENQFSEVGTECQGTYALHGIKQTVVNQMYELEHSRTKIHCNS